MDDYYAFVAFIQSTPSLDQLRSTYSPEKVRDVVKRCGKSSLWMNVGAEIDWTLLYYKWLFDECHLPLDTGIYTPNFFRDSNFLFPLDWVVYYGQWPVESLDFFLSRRAPTCVGLDALYSSFHFQEAKLRLIEAGAKPRDSNDFCYNYYAFRLSHRAAVMAWLSVVAERRRPDLRRVVARDLWLWSQCRAQWLSHN